jgi:predicted transcriptional regulator
MFIRRIQIVRIKRPEELSVNDELQWLGHALGLFGERDKDKSCFRIFIALLKATKQHDVLSSDALAEQLQLSRGTVVHHLNSLMERGMIRHEGNKYALRSENLVELIEDVHRDLERALDEIKKTAQELDRALAL